MLKKVLIWVTLAIGLTSLAYAGSAPDMQEGLWEITTKVKMKGLPVSIPEVKDTQCLTKKDFIPQEPQGNQDCTISDTKISGNTVSWKMECKSSGGTTKGNGTVTYKGDSFEGTMTMSVPGNMKMINNMKGKRIGDCTK